MSSLSWYWHRFRAMSPAELAGHGRRKACQLSDSLFGARRFSVNQPMPPGSTFPKLPVPDHAPEVLKAALRKDADDILSGRWIAFGHLVLQVEDPPRWHKDYLAGVDLATSKPALKLHHRLEGTADIKLIWEPSRWYSLVRLAQAAFVLRYAPAADACRRLLSNWAHENPPYYGWNWTSALESGLRLAQFVWIDALLGGAGDRVASDIVPAHLWFTWRNRSFGSSANNHLIGELAGLIVALARWPKLDSRAARLEKVQQLWETQVLEQFAEDGGNREQALNYHLFSWEFCWQARAALIAAGREISPKVEERLRQAAQFFRAVQSGKEPWDYGDSDSAYVTPFFQEWQNATPEWYGWLNDTRRGEAIRYWLGSPPKPVPAPVGTTGARGWSVYPASGLAVCRARDWFLRWDLSPLGYLSTAGHGHCDALHLSIWHKDRAVTIDPGTGAYHADRRVRDYLASWQAHNGPHPPQLNVPERRGAFLWAGRHERPRWHTVSEDSIRAELELPCGTLRRDLIRLEKEDGWRVEDSFRSTDPNGSERIVVFWQLSPNLRLSRLSTTTFCIEVETDRLLVEVDPAWEKIEFGPPESAKASLPERADLHGLCSPAFRAIQRGPFIRLEGTVSGDRTLRTDFVASVLPRNADFSPPERSSG